MSPAYTMIFLPDNRKHLIRHRTFLPSNERGRGRTDYHAGRILIPHRHLYYFL